MTDAVLSQTLAIISLLAAGQGLGILLLILSSSRRLNISHYLLIAYIALNCGSFIIEYFIYSHIPLSNSLNRSLLLVLLEGPLFYFYVRSLVTPNFRLQPVHLIHIIPPLVIAYIMSSQFPATRLIQSTGYHLLLVSYLFACITLLPHYNQFIRRRFSSIERIDLDWLYKLVIVYILSSIILLTLRMLAYISVIEELHLRQFAHIPNTFVFFVCFYLIGIGGYRQKKPEFVATPNEDKAVATAIQKKKYRYSPIKQEELGQLSEKLNTYMISREPFLEEGLTSLQLAEAVGLSTYQLSQVLNTVANQNFYDYINRYRAEKARHIIENNSDASMPMIDIGIEAGFSNKTTFYKHFKKSFGQTPLQYKKSLNT